jgi:hypothetical protein
MTTSIVGTANKLAEVGAYFALGDVWRCDCGLEHNFGAYAAAHWDESLLHTCGCGTNRTFKRGKVTKSNKP